MHDLTDLVSASTMQNLSLDVVSLIADERPEEREEREKNVSQRATLSKVLQVCRRQNNPQLRESNVGTVVFD